MAIRPQLYIDLDGVLADFETFYEQQFGIKPSRQDNSQKFWEKIRQHKRFYAELPIMPGADFLWEEAQLLHPNPIILTGLPSSIPGVEEHKREWVKRFISETAQVICCMSKDKSRYCKPGDILIDDWDKYKHLWEQAGGIFILHRSVLESLNLAEDYLEIS